MDQHFLNAPMEKNIPIIMGLLGVWNSSFMGYNSRALIPYAQALLRLPAHIQQLDMEVSFVIIFLVSVSPFLDVAITHAMPTLVIPPHSQMERE